MSAKRDERKMRSYNLSATARIVILLAIIILLTIIASASPLPVDVNNVAWITFSNDGGTVTNRTLVGTVDTMENFSGSLSVLVQRPGKSLLGDFVGRTKVDLATKSFSFIFTGLGDYILELYHVVNSTIAVSHGMEASFEELVFCSAIRITV